jgi:Domain of unknown function (DUF6305)
MKRFLPALTCLTMALMLLPFSAGSSANSKFNTYPNLPAPIAKEEILITSAGQAVESSILQSIAEKLNLQADYRPRALATDLYEYESVVIVVGFSKHGLSQTVRNFKEELNRVKALVMEAEKSSLSVILVDISGMLRNDNRSWQLVEELIPYTTYYIGMKSSERMDYLRFMLKENKVPTTLVDDISGIEVPFNSAYR